MPVFNLFTGVVLLSLSLPAIAQEHDSVVLHTMTDYRDELSYDEIIRYNDGLEVFNLRVSYNLDGKERGEWADSTITVTSLSKEGKPLLRTTRMIRREECPPEPVDYTQSFSPFDFPHYDAVIFYIDTLENGSGVFKADSLPDQLEEVLVEEPQCYSHYHDTIVFEELREVKKGVYEAPDYKEISNDTTWYYPNHLLKETVHYEHGNFYSSKKYRYEYDAEGRPVRTFESINDRNSFTDLETHNVYEGSKPHETYWKAVYNKDSANFRAIERIYDRNFDQVKYVSFENGAFAGYGIAGFSNGLMMENKTYDKDSILIDHDIYHGKIKRSRNRTEYWNLLNQRDDDEPGGVGYSRYDTIRTANTVEVRSYGTQISGRKFRRPDLRDCRPGQFVTYDRHGRYLEIHSYDYETGALVYSAAYSYSH